MLTPTSSAKIKNEWNCTSAPPICLHGMDGETLSYFVDFSHGSKKNWSSRKPHVPSILEWRSHVCNCLPSSTIYLLLWVWYVKLNWTC